VKWEEERKRGRGGARRGKEGSDVKADIEVE
jgi:hypothetical protein